MLLQYFDFCCLGFVLVSLILWAFAGYAYRANSRLPDDDPNKKKFPVAAVHLAPLSWLLFAFGSLILFMLKLIVFGIFLLLFTAALVAFRKPFLLRWLEKTAARIGRKLLEANALLLRIAFPHSAGVRTS